MEFGTGVVDRSFLDSPRLPIASCSVLFPAVLFFVPWRALICSHYVKNRTEKGTLEKAEIFDVLVENGTVH